VAALQEVPLNANALEPLSMATQKAGDEHDTEDRPVWVLGAGSLTRGAGLHELPLNRKADGSRASTAMQKLTVGHDTELGSEPGDASRAGWLHLVPSYRAS